MVLSTSFGGLKSFVGVASNNEQSVELACVLIEGFLFMYFCKWILIATFLENLGPAVADCSLPMGKNIF